MLVGKMIVTDPETGETVKLNDTDELREDIRNYHDRECKHAEAQIRRVQVAGGAIHFKMQCLVCGELLGQPIRKVDAPADAPLKDDLLYERYRADRSSQYDSIISQHLRTQKVRESEWWRKYNIYLKSPEWRSKSQKVLRRAQNLCEGCQNKPATQAHHLTYEHVFGEFLFELVALCDECHSRLHEQERLATVDEWQDDFVCAGCRWQGEKGHRRWCAQFETLAIDALSPAGKCGAEHAGFEPLK
jgi:hypothetical protein